MMMKRNWTRLLIFMMTAACTLLFSACGNTSNQPAETENGDEPAVTDDAENGETSESADAGNPDFALTMRDIIDANSAEALFENYNNILAEYEYHYDAPEDYLTAKYMDSDVAYMDYGVEQDLFFRDGSSAYLRAGEEYGGLLLFDFDDTVYHYFTLDADLTAEEEIVSVEQKENTVEVTTHLSVEAFRPYYGDDEFPYDDGDYIEEFYILNAADRAILETSSTLAHADGSKEAQDTTTITYGVEKPELIDELIARRNTDDPRTGTIILDPGTPEERAASAVAQKGEAIYFVLPEGYEALYTDPECTRESPEEESDMNEDFILYSVKE